jgi:hypothetical protein
LAEALELTLDEVVAAGRVLFGPAFVAHGRWRDQLRGTFRRRALETHPDRALALGRDAGELAREFRAVSEAYRALSELRAVPAPQHRAAPRQAPPRQPQPRRAQPRPPSARRTRRAQPERGRAAAASPGAPPSAPGASPARPPDPRAAATRVASPWASIRPPAVVPRRRLRLAEFLYYTGRVPWPALVEAIAWQRRQRPALGAIAVGFGFLTPGEVAELLSRRLAEAAYRVPFGEYAVREGLLTPFQLLAVLGRQLRLQRPIGQFFVERGLVEDAELEAVRRSMLSHNLRWR